MASNSDTNRSAGSLSELLHVAVPLIVSSGSLTIMHITDRMFLTWYSQDALAAALPGSLLHWTVISIAIGTATYANTFVAQYEGAGRPDRVAASMWQGVYFSLIAGMVVALFAPLAEPICRWIGHAPNVQKLEADYFAILCLGSVPIILSAALSCFFSGRGQTLVVMYVNVIAMAVNIVLDYAMVFGWGPIPSWGMRGAAVATVIANVVSVVLYAALILRPATCREYAIMAGRRFDRELFSRFLRYGLPNGFQLFADVISFTVFILLIGKLGAVELAATNLAFNLNTLAFVPMLGVGTAVMTLVGQRVGEGRPELAVRTTWMALRLSWLYMAVFSAVYLLLPDLIIAPYALYADMQNFEELRNEVVRLLRFVAVYSFFDAMVIVFGFAVRGAGDTRFSLILITVTGWSLMVLPTFVAWRWFGGSLLVSWLSATVYIVALGVGFLVRFQLGHWKTMCVIDEPAGLTSIAAVVTTPECLEVPHG